MKSQKARRIRRRVRFIKLRRIIHCLLIVALACLPYILFIPFQLFVIPVPAQGDVEKAVALKRIFDLLKPEGQFLLGDSAYSFPLSEYQSAYNSNMSKRKAQVSKRLFEQMRTDSSSEFMTFTWILEGILDRVGFTIKKANYPTDWFAHYICKK